MKKLQITTIIASFTAALATVLWTRTVFPGVLTLNKDAMHVNAFGLKAVILFLLCLCGYYFLFDISDRLYTGLLDRIKRTEGKRMVLLRGWTIVTIVLAILYYLSYYPGGVFSDTLGAMNLLQYKVPMNRYPLLYNELIALTVDGGAAIGLSIMGSFAIHTAIQMIITTSLILYILRRMVKAELPDIVVHMVMFFYSVWPIMFHYGVSVWKDTPFVLSFIFMTIALMDICKVLCRAKDGKSENAGESSSVGVSAIIRFIIGCTGVVFFRNNGVYVIIFTCVVMLVAMLIRLSAYGKKLASSIATVIVMPVVFLLILGPVYNAIGVWRAPAEEALGIPIQQIAAVIARDGNIPEDLTEEVDKFFDREAVSGVFFPGNADTVKWSEAFDGEYLSKDHAGELISLWWKLLPHNLRIYVEQYILQTSGFWIIPIFNGVGYDGSITPDNGYGLTQIDLTEKLIGFSMQKVTESLWYVPGALPCWIMFLMMLYSIRHRGLTAGIVYAPMLALWGTIMVATPVASGFRYVSAIFFVLPMGLLWPYLCRGKDGETDE